MKGITFADRPDELRLKLLGTAEVFLDGRSVTFRTRKSLSLLVYLALNPGQHSREDVADLFWPEGGGLDGRASLRTALNYIRQGLGRHAARVLSCTRDTIGVDPGSVQMDLDALEQARQLMPRLTTASLRNLIAVAVQHYRGRFLAGMFLPDAPEFESWIEAQRVHWQHVEAQLLSQLATLQMEAGETEAAIATLEKWTAVNPDDEIAWQRLVELHLGQNRRIAARCTWDSYQRGLRDLNLQPSAVMERLHERIFGWAAERPVDRESQPKDLDIVAAPLVGRGREWACLTGSYRRVQEGRTEVIILEGPAGAGKSRLAEEFMSWTADSGSDVISGRALEGVGSLPYGAIVATLRPRLEAENAPEDLLSDLWLAEIARLLPELRERYPDLVIPPDDALGPGRLFEAVSRLAMGIARRKPIALFIDDSQWADPESRNLLCYAIRRWDETGTRILIILSARTGGAGDPGLEQWLATIEGEATTRRLRLDPLQPGDVIQLVGILAGSDDPESDWAHEFGRWLAHKTGGQPRPLVQTLRAMLERGELRVRSLDDHHWAIEPPALAAIPELAVAGARG